LTWMCVCAHVCVGVCRMAVAAKRQASRRVSREASTHLRPPAVTEISDLHSLLMAKERGSQPPGVLAVCRRRRLMLGWAVVGWHVCVWLCV
jgi:hypothetical protein